MFKYAMKFDDLEGREVEQTFYFNYNLKEIGELMEFGQIRQFWDDKEHLPLEEQIKLLTTPTSESGLTEAENTKQAYDIFHHLILSAFGEKTADNTGFVKNQRTWEYLESHVAFPDMIFEFLEHPETAGDFMEKCLPARRVQEAKANLQKDNQGRLTESSLVKMVEEAEKRQQDPKTRVEPGPEAAAQALGTSPAVEQAAQAVKDDSAADEKKELTPKDIFEMSDEDFDRLDAKTQPPHILMAMFERKSKNPA